MKYLNLLRINQWLKNTVLFIPLFFSQQLLEYDKFIHTLYAFISLCLISSVTYIVNDIVDRKRDRLHPIKKNRPISSGNIRISEALIVIFIIVILLVYVNVFLIKSEYFVLLQIIYVVLMLFYSVCLKNTSIVDAITISIGFVLRVLAGAVLLELELSAMLVVAVIGAALLISFGKRKAEISYLGRKDAVEHRPALKIYPKGVLEGIISSISAVTLISYILYSYSYTTKGFISYLGIYLPPKFQDPQWLLLTLPFAIYVLIRYLVVINRSNSSTPELLWFGDKGLRYGLLMWIILTFLLIYFPQLHTMF